MNTEHVSTTLSGLRLFAARIAWVLIAAVSLALLIALIPINWRTISFDWQVQNALPAVRPYLSVTSFTRYILILRYLSLLTFLATAVLIFWRRSNDWMALLVSATLAAVPVAFNLGGYSETWAYYPQPWREVFRQLREALAAFVVMPGLLAVCFLFPNGRVFPRWLGRAAWLLGGLVGTGMLALALGAWLPPGWQFAADWGWWIFFLSFIAAMVVGLLGQVYRYRRVSGPIERQQTKWVLFSLGLFLGSNLLLGLSVIQLILSQFLEIGRYRALLAVIDLHWGLIVLTLIPVSIAFSILRYRLWDVDLIVNRALVYGALTAAVIALYVITVGALGALFQTAGNVLLSILATGLIAILFNPLRQRLQGAVNRLMYGDRDDPATALARLGQRLETAVAPEAVLPSIVETVTQTLRVPYAEIELTTDDRRPMTVAHPSAVNRPPSIVSFPLIFQSEALGHLRVAPRAPDEAFSAADLRLLNDLVRQAAPAVHAYRLTADLQRSRERIVTAREEERRRLRRNLHDGLGPTLAGQALKLEAALEAVEVDPAAARAQLAELKTQTQALVADVRRLVYDLRPPVLDELGLVPALREQARRVTPPTGGLRVTVAAPDALPPLSAAVEVAAYRIAVEALTNVVKHAQARECVIEISAVDWQAQPFLMLEIVDDGVGLPAQPRPGVGLASMRERAEELGGACLVNPRKPSGVQVLAQLPISAAPAG